jgi:Superinfection immunity protein
METPQDLWKSVLFLLLIGCVYFLPFAAALKRGRKNKAPLFFLNLFFGWTIIGWIATLIWAFLDEAPERNH